MDNQNIEKPSFNGDITLGEKKTYQQAGLDPYLVKCYQHLGYCSPTPVQYYALETYNREQSHSIIAHSKSGTGKTLSFLSIMLTHIISSSAELPQRCAYLIILPTRQLSLQVYQTFKSIVGSFTVVKADSQDEKKTRMRLKQIKPMMCIGGIPFEDDRRSYLSNGGNVLVGTMGRMLEFIDKRLIKVPELHMLILDEGDKLFQSKNKNFMIFLQNALKYTNQNGQLQVHSLIYSATFNNKLLKDLKKKRNYIFIQTLADHQNQLQLNITKDFDSISNLQSKPEDNQGITENAINLDNIKKYKVQVKTDDMSYFGAKIAVLSKILNELTYQRCLIFVQKKTLLEQINERMIERSFDPLLIHGSFSQAARIKLMNQINHSRIIIASDLLARGIDLEIDLVILFDAKKNDTFWHRIGRTGRFGKLGVAISLDNIEDWELYDRQEVQNQLSKVGDKFNKQKEWYGTYMTQLGQWKQLDEDKQVQLEQQFKYFDEQKYMKGRKCHKKDHNHSNAQIPKKQKLSLKDIKSDKQLKELIQKLLSCQSCIEFMSEIESLTNYQFQIKKWVGSQE